MRKISILLGALILVLLATGAASAGRRVVYTWTVADLGQGVWGGGPLFAGGSAGGNVAFSAENGQVIYHLSVTEWSELSPGLLDLCFALREIKGDSGFDPEFCLSDFEEGLPVTGTPIILTNPDGSRILLRATPAN